MKKTPRLIDVERRLISRRNQALANLPKRARMLAKLSNRAQLALRLAVECMDALDHALRDHKCQEDEDRDCRLCWLARDATGTAYAIDQLMQSVECGMDCAFPAACQFTTSEVRLRTALLDARLDDVVECALPDEEEEAAVSPNTVIA